MRSYKEEKMKSKLMMVFLFALMCSGAPALFADEHEHMMPPPYKGSADFEKLKGLAGTWVGTHKMGEKEEPVKAEYAVSSNGSIVVEKLFPGTPGEMVTIYNEKNGKIAMTHFCALGNVPVMDLVSSDATKMNFNLSPTSDIGANEGHMHALTITWQDPDHITHAWKMYMDGKETDTSLFTFARVNGSSAGTAETPKQN